MNELFDLGGRVALVTGASSGIGQAMAQALAGAGASVVLAARRKDELEQAAEGIRSRDGKAVILVADLGDRKALVDIAAGATRPFGAPHILINAAGVNLRQPADDVSFEGWDLTLDLNLTVPMFLARSLVPAMKEKGWGKIINIASLQSLRAFPNGIAYGASKGGISQLTRAMAEAWSSSGICCNAIAPGVFPTALTAPVFDDPEREAWAAEQTAIGRNGRMEDLHGATIFLASRASDYITGQVIFVDGGFTAK